MKCLRVFMTNEFYNKKNGKKFYVQVLELSNGDDSLMLKTISNQPVVVGDEVKLPYLMTDYQSYAVKVEVY